MRRLGYGNYGGFGNSLPSHIQPQSLSDVPSGDLPILPAPADIVPRIPTPLGRQAVSESDPIQNAILNALSFLIDDARYLYFTNLSFSVGTASQVILDTATRKRAYLFIINTHPINRLFVNFKTPATVLAGVPIEANLGFWEWLFTIPQDSINIVANGAGTNGVLTFAEFTPKE